MRNVSTFGAFTTARLGIYASQKGLEVTGNNMTNVNTVGYTRQRLDQISFISGGPDYYAPPMGTKVGNGVITTGVSQLRDPFLDIAYRNANTNVGEADNTLAWLEKVAGVLDEVGDGNDANGVVYNQIQTIINQINQMITEGAGHEEYDGLVRTAAQGLTKLFNIYSKGLVQKKEDLEGELQQDVDTVNKLLKNIQEFNESIRKAEIRGDSALELKDQRNLALDELSKYMKIDVSYEREDVGSGTTVEKLIVSVADSNINLVDGRYITQLEKGTETDGYSIKLSELTDKNGTQLQGSKKEELKSDRLKGALQSSRELLYGKGPFATNTDKTADAAAAEKRGIPYYQKSLDLLANRFAEIMNEANKPKDAGGQPIMGNNGKPLGGDLFDSGNNNKDPITAGNISISSKWETGEVKLQCSKDPNAPSGATDNLTHILAQLTSKEHTFVPETVVAGSSKETMFTGSFQDMFLNIQSILGNDISSTSVVLSSYATTANEVYVDRDSVSGVDLNEEATNMMQYQKAYSAACRLMTTLDQALDKLINGTGTVGL